MNLAVSLGDIIVAASTAGSIFVAYQALKGQIEGFRQQLVSFSDRQAAHAALLKAHATAIQLQREKTAAIEGKVFGRRVEDHKQSFIDATRRDYPDYE